MQIEIDLVFITNSANDIESLESIRVELSCAINKKFRKWTLKKENENFSCDFEIWKFVENVKSCSSETFQLMDFF